MALLLLGACSLDLDGYAGPPGTATDDAGDAPFAFETSGDTGTPPDADGASPDARADARFCTMLFPAPTFCDDFERTGNTRGQWDNIGTSAGGAVVLAPGPSGKELLCTQPAFMSGTAGANINHYFGKISGDLTFAFDLTVDAPPGKGGVQVMSIFVPIGGNKDNQAAVFFNVQGSGFKLAQQTFPAVGNGIYTDTIIATSVLGFGKRRRVVIHLTLGSAPRATVTADGATAFDGALDPFFDVGTSYFSAGVHYADPPAGPLTVHVDNVVIDIK